MTSMKHSGLRELEVLSLIVTEITANREGLLYPMRTDKEYAASGLKCMCKYLSIPLSLPAEEWRKLFKA